MGLSVGLGNVTQVPAGIVSAFAGVTAPAGWLMCYGQAVSRTEYSALFTALSTTYGAGDGSTTFNIPDLRGRAIAGIDNMGGSDAGRLSTANTLGTATGTETVTLASTEIPAHSHPNTLTGTTTFASDGHTHAGQGSLGAAIGATGGNPSAIGYVAGTASGGPGTSTYTVIGTNVGAQAFNHYTPVYGSTAANSASASVGISNANNTGGGGAHSNMQPTIVLNYIIRTNRQRRHQTIRSSSRRTNSQSHSTVNRIRVTNNNLLNNLSNTRSRSTNSCSRSTQLCWTTQPRFNSVTRCHN